MVRKKRDATGLVTGKSLADVASPEGDNIEVIDSAPLKKAVKPEKVGQDMFPQIDLGDIPDGQIFMSEALLNESEKKYYLTRRSQYLEDFNLNGSTDLALLHRALMEEIIGERLYTSILNDPAGLKTKDLSEKMSESHTRYRAAIECLGISRDKRIKNKESDNISVADVAVNYYQERRSKLKEEKERKGSEEEALLNMKKHQFELEYGKLDTEEGTLAGEFGEDG